MKQTAIAIKGILLLCLLCTHTSLFAQQSSLFISKNADFSSEDRSFDQEDVLYVKVVAEAIDFTDIDKNEFRLKPDDGGNDVEHALTNHMDGTYSTHVDLSTTDRREDEWEVRVRLEDHSGREFRTRVEIKIGNGRFDDDDDDDDRRDDEDRDDEDRDEDEVELTGEIESIDGNSLVVAGMTFLVDDRTIIRNDEEQLISFEDLAVGFIVEVRADVQADGSLLASDIKIEDRVANEVQASVPVDLNQNHPNPFNPSTTISFDVLGSDAVVASLAVYNLLGQSVRTLFIGELAGGHYAFEWDGRNEEGQQLASGIYVYRLQVDELVQAKTMVMLK